MVKSMPFTSTSVGVYVEALQSASNMIWMAAPWRWTIGVFPITSAVSAAASTVSLTNQADFLRLEKVNLNNGVNLRELKIVNILPATPAQIQMPNFCAYVQNGSSPYLQFETKMPTGVNDFKAYAWYKREAPVITASTYDDAGFLEMDDEWFWVFQEAVLYYGYKFADDPRAGGAQVEETNNGPKIIYSGQRAVLQAAIEEMRQREELVSMFPQLNPVPVQQKGPQG